MDLFICLLPSACIFGSLYIVSLKHESLSCCKWWEFWIIEMASKFGNLFYRDGNLKLNSQYVLVFSGKLTCNEYFMHFLWVSMFLFGND